MVNLSFSYRLVTIRYVFKGIYPFTLPTTMPFTKYFWKNGKTTSAGPATTNSMAILTVSLGMEVISTICPLPVSSSFVNAVIFMRISCKRKFRLTRSDRLLIYSKEVYQPFQLPRKVPNAIVANTGLESGIMKVSKIRNSLAPSITADSTISSGTA